MEDEGKTSLPLSANRWPRLGSQILGRGSCLILLTRRHNHTVHIARHGVAVRSSRRRSVCQHSKQWRSMRGEMHEPRCYSEMPRPRRWGSGRWSERISVWRQSERWVCECCDMSCVSRERLSIKKKEAKVRSVYEVDNTEREYGRRYVSFA